MFSKMRIFQKFFIGVMMTFMGLMGVVTYFAYTRVSGSTRQDMAEAQFIRQKAIIEKRDPDIAASR
ncbi:MAG TPA: hypothetical protein VGP47_02960 [Parachlamydiaceae bacterium]|nr:hypothetical protein [Parachlamydiaceae bacterium]